MEEKTILRPIDTSDETEKVKDTLKGRNITLDIIRVIAVFSVIGVHFFLNSGFYGIPVKGIEMYLGTLGKTFFMICVPLFLLLSGYLMKNKVLSKKYYKGIGKVIGVYVISTLVCLTFMKFVLKQEVTLLSGIKNLLSYQQYSWYVEMYIGLFLIIPFLNLIFKGLDSKGKKVLLITMAFLTAIPSTFNSFDFLKRFYIGFDTVPYSHYTKIFPDFWLKLYPVTYYFLGAFIGENREKICKCKLINPGIFLLSVIIFASYDFYLSHGQNYMWSGISDWGSVQNLVNASLVFLIVLKYNVVAKGESNESLEENFQKTIHLPKRLCKIISKLSEISFGTYLLSWIADKITYPVLVNKIASFGERLPFIFIIVPLNFALSSLMSAIVFWIYKKLCSVSKLK